MTTKTTDNKGRLPLGSKFANKTFIVEEINENEVRLTEAAIVPKRELWLHQNPNSLASVVRGIEGAQRREFVEPPNLAADAEAFSDGDA